MVGHSRIYRIGLKDILLGYHILSTQLFMLFNLDRWYVQMQCPSVQYNSKKYNKLMNANLVRKWYLYWCSVSFSPSCYNKLLNRKRAQYVKNSTSCSLHSHIMLSWSISFTWPRVELLHVGMRANVIKNLAHLTQKTRRVCGWTDDPGIWTRAMHFSLVAYLQVQHTNFLL